MKRFIVLVLVAAFAVSVFAQKADSSVVFTAHFVKNEYQKYTLSQALFTLSNKKDTVSLDRISMKAEIFVADSTQNGYILKWKLSDFSVVTAHQEIKKLVALAEPVLISYRISKSGAFQDFADDNKIKSCLTNALPKVLDAYKNREDSVAKTEVERIYAFRDQLEGLMIRFESQFHQFYGLGYNIGETVSVPVEIASPFSAGLIRAVQRKKLVRYDSESGLAHISYATMPDMNAFRKALAESNNLGIKNLRSLILSEIGGMMIDVKTGWPIWSMHQRETSGEGLTFCEQIELQYN